MFTMPNFPMLDVDQVGLAGLPNAIQSSQRNIQNTNINKSKMQQAFQQALQEAIKTRFIAAQQQADVYSKLAPGLLTAGQNVNLYPNVIQKLMSYLPNMQGSSGGQPGQQSMQGPGGGQPGNYGQPSSQMPTTQWGQPAQNYFSGNSPQLQQAIQRAWALKTGLANDNITAKNASAVNSLGNLNSLTSSFPAFSGLSALLRRAMQHYQNQGRSAAAGTLLTNGPSNGSRTSSYIKTKRARNGNLYGFDGKGWLKIDE